MPDKDNKRKVSRLMKVTMDEDEFEKFDKGETHSKKGIRNKRGNLSTVPDIEAVSEDDLPKRTVVRTKRVCVKPEEPTLGQILKEEAKYAIAEKVVDTIVDPYQREAAIQKGKRFINDYVKPFFSNEKEEHRYHTKIERIKAQEMQREHSEIISVDGVVEGTESYVEMTPEQADNLVEMTRQKAKELSAMIFLLSKICIKDEKTDTEIQMGETYINQLLSDETMITMRQLIEHPELLDKETKMCLNDWLNGYIRNGNSRIPIPKRIENN